MAARTTKKVSAETTTKRAPKGEKTPRMKKGGEKTPKTAEPKGEAPEGQKKAKKEHPMANLNGLVAEGFQVWVRECSFDHSHIQVQAVVAIAQDQKSYMVFNTYSGRLDRDEPTTFYFKDEAAVSKKMAGLMKKGYLAYEVVTE